MRTVQERGSSERPHHASATPGNGGREGAPAASGHHFRVLKGWSVEAAAAGLLFCVVGWAAVNLLVGGTGFVTLVSAEFHGSVQAASALARFFAALVLGFFLVEEGGWRMRWVAAGMVVLGLGHLVFGYVEPLIQGDPLEPNESLYEGFVTQTLACALFVVGLLPGTPSRLLKWAAAAVPASLVVAYVVVFEFLSGDDWMPPLVRIHDLEDTVEMSSPFDWTEPLYWVISALPLGLAIAAAGGTFWLSRRGLLRGWILFAMVLLVGSQLHDYLWPSDYGSLVFTDADMLSLAFAAVVAVGGVSDLRRIAVERLALLAAEQERTRRMAELARLKADFSAMVAHELDSPLSAIRKLNEMIDARGADPEVRGYASSTMKGEIEALNVLIDDVRSAGRDEFEVQPRQLPVGTLIDEAKVYARLLPGGHPVTAEFLGGLDAREMVWADPERVAQVLRNLLINAAKYSPPGAPINLRASLGTGQQVRIEVTDHGPGVRPDDVDLIFEKFGRVRDGNERDVVGKGLGLYLSRRIVGGHGSELTVRPAPTGGSTFGFDLKIAR